MFMQSKDQKSGFYYMNSLASDVRNERRVIKPSRPKQRMGPAIWIAGCILAGSVFWLMAVVFHMA